MSQDKDKDNENNHDAGSGYSSDVRQILENPNESYPVSNDVAQDRKVYLWITIMGSKQFDKM